MRPPEPSRSELPRPDRQPDQPPDRRPVGPHHPPDGPAPAELLAWDSAFFERRIGRVHGRRLTRETLAAIDRWAAREQVDCLYFLADAADPETAALAEAAGFRLVDVRVTLERRGLPSGGSERGGETTLAALRPAPSPVPAAPPPEVPTVRPATAADLPELRRIAAASHHDSRFYHDPHFDRHRCDALYAAWIEKSCADPAGAVLVAVGGAAAGQPLGYITGTIAAGGAGQIGLFAIAAAAQGRGLGGRLIAAAFDWFATRGADRVSVVTQGRNVAAQRIYQRHGLLTRSVELWFHRWQEPTAGGPERRRP